MLTLIFVPILFYKGFCFVLVLKLKFRFKLPSQSEVWSMRSIVGTGWSLIWITTLSPRCSSLRNLPSNATHASDLASSGTVHRMTTWSGNTIDRKLSTWGQIGVTSIAGTTGWTTDPPAAMLYAVDPVGLLVRKQFRELASNFRFFSEIIAKWTGHLRRKNYTISLNCC